MSSEIVNTTSEIPQRSPEVKQDVSVSPNGTLNPNAAVFNHLSLMTLSAKGTGTQTTSTVSPFPLQFQENVEDPNKTIGAMADGLQYSPQAVNGYGESFTSPNPITDMSQSQEISPDKLPLKELKALLQRQLEYYFSRENLSRDTYLLSQMDGDNFVPIWTVANFNQIKKMTKDIELIKEVLRESPLLQMNDLCEKVRANVKRCIVVLREIPEATPIEEVKALFDGEGCPKHSKCEFASNDYWYIFFENEECAQKAYQYLREVVKTFKGKPIMARIKANTIHQSAPPKTVPPPTPPQMDNTVITPPHQAPVYSQFQFPPVPPMFNNAQQYQPFFPAPPNMMHTWPPGQHYQDQHVPQGFPHNGYPGPLKGKQEKTGGSNSMRHGYQPNRQRYPNLVKTNFREQANERNDREAIHRPKPPSANGSLGNVPPTSSPTTTSSMGNASSSGTSTNSSASRENSKNNPGSLKTREGRDVDELSRRNTKPIRRRRGSSEDIRRESRHKENRSSPVRHSKDDSDTSEVLAPSNFPPLPTGKKSTMESPESKNTPAKVEKPVTNPVQSPAPWSKITESAHGQNRPKPEALPPAKPVEKAISPKEPASTIKPEKSPPAVTEKPTAVTQTNSNRQAEKKSYAQMAAQKSPKSTCNTSPPPNNQTKSPGK